MPWSNEKFSVLAADEERFSLLEAVNERYVSKKVLVIF